MSIKWIRDASLIATFPTRSNPIQCAADIRNIFDVISEEVLTTDTLLCKTGEADFGDTYATYFPACKFTSNKITDNLWRHQIRIDRIGPVEAPLKALGISGFALPAGAIEFTNMKFKNKCSDPNEDSAIMGWYQDATVSSAVFNDCILDGSESCDWGFYSWFSGAKTLTMNDCTLYYNRFGVSLASSGASGQTLVMNRCRGYGDANGSQSYGESSGLDIVNGGQVAMVLLRSGTATLNDCEADAIGLTAEFAPGDWGCPKIAALISSQYFANPGTVNVNLNGCKANITPNLSVNYFDYDLRNSNAPVIDRRIGTGTEGDYKIAT